MPDAAPLAPVNPPAAHRGYVLITGASTGIGQACATHLAGLGFQVFAGVRNEPNALALRQAGEAIAGAGGICPILLDVTDPASIAAAANKLAADMGTAGLTALVNNAGISVSGPVELVTLDDWRRQFEVNFFGAIAVTQAMLPLLRRRTAIAGPGSARIVMMSSVAGKIAQPITAPYTASKFALESLSDSLRLELRPQGITVCIVEPGAIDTPIWSKGMAAVIALPDDQAKANYGPLMDRVIEAVRKISAGAIPPAAVAKAVGDCLTRRRPRIRYPVGRDAKAGVLSRRFMPDWAFDLALRRFYRLR
jgi:NAD(P)-dependent dehydrogenase (short-subunit alcohol dehydrogenase family)